MPNLQAGSAGLPGSLPNPRRAGTAATAATVSQSVQPVVMPPSAVNPAPVT